MHVTCTPPGLYIVDLYTFYPLFFYLIVVVLNLTAC